ncbi:MAG: Mur ligase family protein [Patescibacteria group bacterium]|jgi:UDP-N-acetylmuramoyl-tripeptide--D-alanyl-D-alanine ligase
MKKIILKILAIFARAIIKKYKPKIVGITGSVGKTGTKEFITLVLSNRFRVRSSIKNYNNEFGLPLSIIGRESPGKNFWGWLKVFYEAKRLLLFKDRNYPEILVLEMGIDRSGDMDYLLSIVKPDIGVITNISHSHVEYFGSLEKIKKEKIKLVKNLKKDGLAVLNFDNKYLKDASPELKSKAFYYGTNDGADFLAKDISFSLSGDLLSDSFCGINFKLEHGGSVVPIILPRAISFSSIYSSLAALVVGFHLGLNLIEMAGYLNKIYPLPGRMNILLGLKNSVLIDDTYNSSPESALSALETLKNISTKNRKIVILGDMLELGHYTEEGHQLVGQKVAEIKADLLVLIGERARDIGRGAKEKGFNPDNIFVFPNVSSSKDFVKDRISSNDIVLLKASQGVRLEKLVKEIMNNSSQAEELLVRQDSQWS